MINKCKKKLETFSKFLSSKLPLQSCLFIFVFFIWILIFLRCSIILLAISSFVLWFAPNSSAFRLLLLQKWDFTWRKWFKHENPDEKMINNEKIIALTFHRLLEKHSQNRKHLKIIRRLNLQVHLSAKSKSQDAEACPTPPHSRGRTLLAVEANVYRQTKCTEQTTNFSSGYFQPKQCKLKRTSPSKMSIHLHWSLQNGPHLIWPNYNISPTSVCGSETLITQTANLAGLLPSFADLYWFTTGAKATTSCLSPSEPFFLNTMHSIHSMQWVGSIHSTTTSTKRTSTKPLSPLQARHSTFSLLPVASLLQSPHQNRLDGQLAISPIQLPCTDTPANY